MKLGLLGESGHDRFDDNSSQLTQNWHIHSAVGGKSKLALYPTPGLTIFEDIGTGPIRGDINYNGLYFVISGNEFYEVDAAGSSTLRGTLNTSVGICKLDHNGAKNGKQICIVDGTNGYIWNTEYSTFSQIKQFSTGTTDSTTADKLEDSGADFITDGVVAGTIVYNTTDGTKATVTAVDDLNTLSVSSDIFVSGEAYEVGTDAFPNGATHVEFFDGFFLWNNPAKSGEFYKSKGYDGTDIDALEFATAERSPDELQGLLKVDRILWLIGKETGEAWFDTGASDFPFEPIPSGFSEWGTVAPYSLVETAGLAFWVSQNEEGNGMVIMASGLQVNIISTPEIAAEIANITDISDCYAYTYQKFQHTFVVFTFPSGEKTIVFDTTEQKWHTWKSKTLGYHRSTGHTFIYGKHLVGDPANGRIYELDWDNNTDNGDTIERRRVTTVFHADDKGLDWQVVELDIKEGVNQIAKPFDVVIHTGSAATYLPGIVIDPASDFSAEGVRIGDTYKEISSGVTSIITSISGVLLNLDTSSFTGTPPEAYEITRVSNTFRDAQIHLRWREDNGAWSNWHSRSMGKIGERNKRVRWRQLGYTDNSRVFEIMVSDPVPAILLDGYARIKVDSTEFR